MGSAEAAPAAAPPPLRSFAAASASPPARGADFARNARTVFAPHPSRRKPMPKAAAESPPSRPALIDWDSGLQLPSSAWHTGAAEAVALLRGSHWEGNCTVAEKEKNGRGPTVSTA